jgi:hypothetical protein
MSVDLPIVLISIDTEALTHRAKSDHVRRLIFGQMDGGEHGIGKICDLLDTANTKATFFLDFAECCLYADKILDVARFLSGRGQDVQLHVHIETMASKYPSLRGKKLDELSRNECAAVLDYLCGQHRAAGLPPPIAYRAGALRYNAAMLEELVAHQIPFSSNYAARFAGTDTTYPLRREFRWSNGICEVPITTAIDAGRRIAFDYNSVDLQAEEQYEIALVHSARELKAKTACLLMHSWSFLDWPDQGSTYFSTPKTDKTVLFSKLLARSGKDLKFETFASLNARIANLEMFSDVVDIAHAPQTARTS